MDQVMMRAFFFAISFAWIVGVSAFSQDEAVSSEDFENMVFDGVDIAQGPKATLEKQVELEIKRIDMVCRLRSDQLDRLRLAGFGDIKRFNDQLTKARLAFLASDGGDDQRWNVAWQLASPLQQKLSKGLFCQGSLFQKVAVHSLDADQLANWQRELAAADRQHAEAMVMMFVSKLQTVIPMTFRQRSQLTELVLEGLDMKRQRGHESVMKVYQQFAKVPKSKYEAIFDENQMKVIDELHGMLDHPFDLDDAEMEVMANDE
jgi:hypothetical protein